MGKNHTVFGYRRCNVNEYQSWASTSRGRTAGWKQIQAAHGGRGRRQHRSCLGGEGLRARLTTRTTAAAAATMPAADATTATGAAADATTTTVAAVCGGDVDSGWRQKLK